MKIPAMRIESSVGSSRERVGASVRSRRTEGPNPLLKGPQWTRWHGSDISLICAPEDVRDRGISYPHLLREPDPSIRYGYTYEDIPADMTVVDHNTSYS